jgi:hypothetical protein
MMTREEVDDLVDRILANPDAAPSARSLHPLLAITGSEPVPPDVRKISGESMRELQHRNKLQQIDLQFAASEQPRPQPAIANYDQALSWIRYRCPEKIGSGFHRSYRGERDRCVLELRKALEMGDLVGATDDGRTMLPADWDFVDLNGNSSFRFRWSDLYLIWPAAFLEMPFKPVRADAGVPPADQCVRQKAVFAWLVCQRANQPSQRGQDELIAFIRDAPRGTYNPPLVDQVLALRGSWKDLFSAVKKRGPITDEDWSTYVEIAKGYLAERGIAAPDALPTYLGGSEQPEYSYPPNL